jgi:hypothetical protein
MLIDKNGMFQQVPMDNVSLSHTKQTNWISSLKVIAINPHSDSGIDLIHHVCIVVTFAIDSTHPYVVH